jgi:hypothetical protein
MKFVYPRYNVAAQVKTVGELKEVVRNLRDKHDLRGSTWDWNGAKLYDDKGGLIGEVAYNGKVVKA